eukprot:scaffold149819_cov16-Tisochrysis_lutea.AAC.2
MCPPETGEKWMTQITLLTSDHRQRHHTSALGPCYVPKIKQLKPQYTMLGYLQEKGWKRSGTNHFGTVQARFPHKENG